RRGFGGATLSVAFCCWGAPISATASRLTGRIVPKQRGRSILGTSLGSVHPVQGCGRTIRGFYPDRRCDVRGVATPCWTRRQLPWFLVANLSTYGLDSGRRGHDRSGTGKWQGSPAPICVDIQNCAASLSPDETSLGRRPFEEARAAFATR